MTRFHIYHTSIAIIGIILIANAMISKLSNYSKLSIILLNLVGSRLVVSSSYNFVVNDSDDFDIGRYNFWTINLLALLALGWISYQLLK